MDVLSKYVSGDRRKLRGASLRGLARAVAAGLCLVAVLTAAPATASLTRTEQEARRVAGTGAPRLIAAMTAAFALGQLLGPVVVSGLSSTTHALYVPSVAAAVLLIAGAAILTASRRPHDACSSI